VWWKTGSVFSSIDDVVSDLLKWDTTTSRYDVLLLGNEVPHRLLVGRQTRRRSTG
jgi:hypothetical protein